MVGQSSRVMTVYEIEESIADSNNDDCFDAFESFDDGF